MKHIYFTSIYSTKSTPSMSLRPLIVGMSISLLAACTWVKPTEQAESVALVNDSHVSDCRLLGQTVANVKDSLGILKRREKKVEVELLTLAKNAASAMSGDSIVPKTEPTDGKQTFAVYDCSGKAL